MLIIEEEPLQLAVEECIGPMEFIEQPEEECIANIVPMEFIELPEEEWIELIEPMELIELPEEECTELIELPRKSSGEAESILAIVLFTVAPIVSTAIIAHLHRPFSHVLDPHKIATI